MRTSGFLQLVDVSLVMLFTEAVKLKVFFPATDLDALYCEFLKLANILFCHRGGGGTGMIASISTVRPHPGRVIRDLFHLLNAVYGIVRKH